MSKFWFIIIISILFLSIGVEAKVDTLHVAYFEAGDYFIHKIIYRDISKNLEILQGDSVEIIFEPTGYKSADWKRDRCRAMAGELTRATDIDIVLAAGPWVINDLLEAGFKKPIIGIYQYAPTMTGLINQAGNPIAENLTISYDPRKITNDLEMMNKIFPTDRIGILYFPEAGEFNEMKNAIHKVAGGFGASVFSSEKYDNYNTYSFYKSFNDIRNQVKALYLPPLWGMDNEQIRQFFFETVRARIPTYSSEGFLLVEKGATASNNTHEFKTLGLLNAVKIIRLAKGAKVSELPIFYNEPRALALNLDTSEKLRLRFNRNYKINARQKPALPSVDLEPYSLSMAIEQAERENPEYHLYESRVNSELARMSVAKSSMYPRVSLDVSIATAGNETEARIYDSFNRRANADISLKQILFSYPVFNSIKNAGKSVELNELNRDMFSKQLKESVASAFMKAIRIEELILANQERIEDYRLFLTESSILAEIGLVDSLDILVCEESLVRAKMKNQQLQSEKTVVNSALNILIGRPGDQEILLNGKEFDTDVMVFLAGKIGDYTRTDIMLDKFKNYLIETGITNSFDLQKSDIDISIIRSRASSAKKWYFPEIGIGAKYSLGREFDPELDKRDNYWTVGGYLSLPLFDLKSMKGESQVLESQLDEQIYAKDKIRLEKYHRILDVSTRFISRVSTLPMNYYLNNISNRTVDAYREKYISGTSGALELLNRIENSYANKTETINSRFIFFEEYSGLLCELGFDYLYHGTGNQKQFFDNIEQYLKN